MSSPAKPSWVYYWAVGGVLAIFVEAIVRLSLFARDAWLHEWTAFHWLTLVIWTAAMWWGEGYRTFQRYVAPRVVQRATHLALQPFSAKCVLAPLYALSFFDAEPRAKRIAWSVTIFVFAFAWGMHFVPHPWRGIIDFGVVVALAWGVLAIGKEALAARLNPRRFSSPL